jgi:hypothetical protein
MSANAWSNIDIASDDPEIIEIDKFEITLGSLSSNAQQIRELITRFEVCHFKYQQHIRYIKESIFNLKPSINPQKIGKAHIRNRENTWKRDKTGRSLLGQKYVSALNNWLSDNYKITDLDYYDKNLSRQITNWLGKRNPDKERLVRLLLARLNWNWELYEKLQYGDEYKQLELQVCRIDICHYSFPNNLDLLLQGIGEMKPIEAFEGCGSFNSDIKIFANKEFSVLNGFLKSIISGNQSQKDKSVKVWLIACLAKTLKEQVTLTQPIPRLIRNSNQSF